MSYRRNNGVKGLSLFAVTCISITILLSIIGVGYGYWQNGIEVSNSISTGNMKVVISNYKVFKKICDKNLITVSLDDKSKKMNVNIKDASRGNEVVVWYKITNNGSIPAKCRLTNICKEDDKNTSKNSKSPLELINLNKSGITLGVGKSMEGIMIIKINNIDGKQNYNLPINLVFDQYNERD